MSNLVYIMGPSGCGKDSLMAAARQMLPAGAGVVFAHRYITRPPDETDAGGENHIFLSETEFSLRLERDLFALHWESHGLRYGIGREIDLWLGAGLTVVMNGSRAALEQALAAYPSIVPILIEVSEDVLLTRLRTRGRENEAQIRDRLHRAALVVPDCPGLIRVDNGLPLAEAAKNMLQRILAATRVAL